MVKIKVILHQFWVKKFSPWKLNLEYGGTFTKLFMYVSSRNMFPTICVHVYRPRYCCGVRTVQLMKKISDASNNIFHVYHIRIIAPQKNGSHDMKRTDSSIIIVRNECVLTSASMIVYLFVTRSWSAIIGTLLSYSCMFQVEICSQQSVCMFIVLAIVVETD
jgi:hypothetical protein